MIYGLAIVGAAAVVCGIAAFVGLVMALIDTFASDRADEAAMDNLIARQVEEEEKA